MLKSAWSFVWRWVGNLLRIKALWELLPPGVTAVLTGLFVINRLPLWIAVLLSIGAGVIMLAVINLFRNPGGSPPSPPTTPPIDRGPRFTGIEVTGDKNTFINTTITPPAPRSTAHGPNMRTDTSFHRWSDAQRLMNACEVVPHVEQRNLVHVVVDLL